MVYSQAELKSNGDKTSPCFRQFWANIYLHRLYHTFCL